MTPALQLSVPRALRSRAPRPACVEVASLSGRYAELVLMTFYMADPVRQAGFSRGDDLLFVDSIFIDPTQRGIGLFLEIHPQAAAGVEGQCEDGTKAMRSLERSLLVRPDILDLGAAEVYEIKSEREREKGVAELRFYQCLLDLIWRNRARLDIRASRLHRPVRPGRRFDPPARHLAVPGGLGLPRVWLEMRRAQPGLLLYRYCVEGTQAPDEVVTAALAKYLHDRMAAFLAAYRKAVGPRALGELLGEPQRAARELAQLRDRLEQFPAVPPRALDVYDEVARRVFTERELQFMLVALLLLPIVGIAVARMAPLLLPLAVRLAAAARAAGSAVATATRASAGVGLRSAVGAAKALEAGSAGAEVAQAPSAAVRVASMARVANAAGEAGATAREAAFLERQAFEAEQAVQASAQRVRQASASVLAAMPAAGPGAAALGKEIEARIDPLAQRRQPRAEAVRAARAEASGAARAAATSARRAGTRPSPRAAPGCTATLGPLAGIYERWARDPDRERHGISVSAAQRMADGTTWLRLVNRSAVVATVFIGPPTCTTVEVVPGSAQEGRPGVMDVQVVAGEHTIGALLGRRPCCYGTVTLKLGVGHVLSLRPR